MQILVIGAGAVGLAVAREAAMAGHDVIVAEAASGIGTGVSSRNSEVIHAGMYYPSGSLRAKHCVRGNRMLYEFCESHGVHYRKCGKLIVATNEAERARVETLHAQGEKNGVEGLGTDRRQCRARARAGARLHRRAQFAGNRHHRRAFLHARLAGRFRKCRRRDRVRNAGRAADAEGESGWEIRFGGRDAGSMDADAVINSAGLGAQALAHKTDGYPVQRIPPLVLAKGNYFSYAGKPVFSRLIYPTPVDGGLGVHVTLDLAGRMRFGPDVEWIDGEHYEVDPGRADSFYARIRTYWPTLADGTLVPDYSGIRPKLTGPGQPAADFMIEGPAQHGMAGLVHLFGIESPGLTSALSIAQDVVGRLKN